MLSVKFSAGWGFNMKPSFEDTAIRVGREAALKLVAAGLIENERVSANTIRARRAIYEGARGHLSLSTRQAIRDGKDDQHALMREIVKELNEVNPKGKVA